MPILFMTFPYLPAIHLSMFAPNARRGGQNAEASLVREASSERCFAKVAKMRRGLAAPKMSQAVKSNPAELNFLGIPRLVASTASRLVSLSMLADTRI
jgi:hypothetical protein